MAEKRSDETTLADDGSARDNRSMELLGRGRCADIFALDDSLALKIYQDRFDQATVEQFAEIGRQVAEAGVATPAIHGVEQRDGCYGIIMDRLDGETMWEAIRRRPDHAEQWGVALAELHLHVHEHTVPGMRDGVEMAHRFLGMASIDDNLKRRATAVIETADTYKTVLLHGDLHPANIMVVDDELISLDWDGARSGPAILDVSRTFYLVDSWALAPGTDPLPASVRSAVANSFVEAYVERSSLSTEEVREWNLPVVAARYRENVPGEPPLLESQLAAISDVKR